MVTLAATFVLVYNADLILGPLTRLGRFLGAMLPSIKMAVAYPLANKTRTGLTMAMFCLVVFALTVMSATNFNFNRLFLSDRALGGFDVTVDENPTNPIPDLRAALQAASSPAAQQVEAVGTVGIIPRNAVRVCQPRASNPCDAANPRSEFARYPLWGEDPQFFAAREIHLQARARGFDSDDAAWQAVANDPSLVIVDPNTLVGTGFVQAFIHGLEPDSQDFEPISLVLLNPLTGRQITVRVVGVIEMGTSVSYGAIHASSATLEQAFGAPHLRRFFVKTTPDSDNEEVARQIESSLLSVGAQAESLRDQVDEVTATQTSFFYLMQGFMGLGLFVGVAAVGVIAFRTVVERRQQIGMLRALGYTRRMIGLTFLIESAFIALMGVVSGIVLAVILSSQLITEIFAIQGVTSFVIPWGEVCAIGAIAFGFALLMTLIPSRQAASIPIAQALRYE